MKLATPTQSLPRLVTNHSNTTPTTILLHTLYKLDCNHTNTSYTKTQLFATMISSHITLAILAIIAILSSTTTNAQLSTLPKRYRSNKVQSSSTTTVNHTLKQHKTKKNGHLRKKRYLRKDPELNYMSMNNLFTTRMSLSMPNLEEARFDIPDLDFMSMPLEEARFDIPIGSMPLNVFDIEPDNSDGDMNMMSVGLGKSSSSSDTLILASMLAGLSALVVGSAAVFMKMRKVHSDQCIEDKEEEEEMEMQQQQQQLDPEERVVSFASQDELYQPDDSEEYDNVQDLPLY